MIFGKDMNRYYLRYGWMLLLGVLALVIVDVGQLKIPELYRMVVNGMNRGVVEVSGTMRSFDMDFLLDGICLPMVVIIAMMVTGRFLWRVCFFGAAIRVETDLRDRMFNHCKDLSQQYYQVNKVGNLMSLFTNDLETVQDCYGNGVLMFFDALVLGGLALVKMLRMNLWLTVLSLIPMAFLFVCGSIVGRYMSAKWEIRQAAFSELSDFSQESFSGIAVIKAFAKEGLELLAFRKLNRDNEHANVEYTRISTLLSISITLFVESVVCVILGYGGYLVHRGIFGAGEMVEFIGYFTTIVWPIEAVAMLIEMSAKGKASLKRISALLDAPVDVKDGAQVCALEHCRGEITYKNLTFAYPGTDRAVLRDVSFTVDPGEQVGIIGKTGAGKSTLVDLLVRTENVPEGTVFVDGVDVNHLSIHGVRDQIAYVPQDNFLFSDTIEENIAFAVKGPKDRQMVMAAARAADVHENIQEFPQNYDTVLGERGVTVSGGQKQRISIARALMRDAQILILDDSVSAVDTKTERVILENLKAMRAGKTTLLVAHRISTIAHMDKIIFLDEGRVVAVGDHGTLMKTCPAYVDMVNRQLLEDDQRKDGQA